MKDFRYFDGVATLKLDGETCIGCGNCAEVCPHGVLVVESVESGKKARIVDFDGCMECGACMTNCPVEAVTVTPGVGCAAYIIASWLNRAGIRSSSACCG
ncbi:MAG: 4Fe-4S binding protein [Proteobacteria bacterium]|nr:4Fe-4S binding protein [Pseudomonadota bacterium]MBU1612226.1 4Fe-4S binding protein [Pseudomonadota bacterium]